MIVLLGGTGYIGQAFEKLLTQRGLKFISISRKQVNYTHFDSLFKFLREKRPEFVINAAGYTGKPNVDACEANWADTLQGNTLFAATVANACSALEIPFGHVSSGCIYSGAKIQTGGTNRIEKELTKPELKKVIDQHPEVVRGFTEEDVPNFSFRDKPCSFYSGTKALGEESIESVGQNYIWRLRIPFDEFDSPRNYLSKLQNYSKVYDNVNSLSHRADFVAACLELWLRRAPFGKYNVTNPGWVTSRQVVELIQQELKPSRNFEFWADNEEFYRLAAKTPRSNCVLDISKLLTTGIKMRPIEEALAEALRKWTKSA